MNPKHRVELFELHPHDRRRGASVVCMEDGSTACVDQREVELAAVMVKARLGD